MPQKRQRQTFMKIQENASKISLFSCPEKTSQPVKKMPRQKCCMLFSLMNLLMCFFLQSQCNAKQLLKNVFPTDDTHLREIWKFGYVDFEIFMFARIMEINLKSAQWLDMGSHENKKSYMAQDHLDPG